MAFCCHNVLLHLQKFWICFDVDGVISDVLQFKRRTLEALQNAYAQSTATMKERMEELTGGLNLPGLSGMGG